MAQTQGTVPVHYQEVERVEVLATLLEVERA